MKTKTGFNIRQMCGENIIVAEGEQNIDFSNIISMNDSAAFLWQKLQGREAFTIADMTALLCEEYEVDEKTARHDATMLAATWAQAGIIEGEDIPQVELPAAAAPQNDDSKAGQANHESAPAAQPTKRKGFFARLFGK